MRYESVGPDVAVLDLLARVDELSAAAVVAIEHGDDAALSELLDQRGVVVEAAISAWQRASGAGPTPELASRVAAAVQRCVRIGHEAQAVAIRVKAAVATELSTLDARQSASLEYQPGSVQSAINVVL